MMEEIPEHERLEGIRMGCLRMAISSFAPEQRAMMSTQTIVERAAEFTTFVVRDTLSSEAGAREQG